MSTAADHHRLLTRLWWTRFGAMLLACLAGLVAMRLRPEVGHSIAGLVGYLVASRADGERRLFPHAR